MNLRTLIAVVLSIASATAVASGPIGVGPLQIGLTQAQVEALPATGGIHLAEPLGPYVPPGGRPVELKPGEERFAAKVQTPWDGAPLDSSLTFTNGSLSSIYIKLNDSEALMKRVADQIAEKFGAAKVVDDTKVERCPSYGGGSTEIESGSLSHRWSVVQGQKEIRTSVSSYVLESCLSRSYGQARSVLTSLSIWTVDAVANPF